jgi:hypothetical protein
VKHQFANEKIDVEARGDEADTAAFAAEFGVLEQRREEWRRTRLSMLDTDNNQPSTSSPSSLSSSTATNSLRSARPAKLTPLENQVCVSAFFTIIFINVDHCRARALSLHICVVCWIA